MSHYDEDIIIIIIDYLLWILFILNKIKTKIYDYITKLLHAII